MRRDVIHDVRSRYDSALQTELAQRMLQQLKFAQPLPARGFIEVVPRNWVTAESCHECHPSRANFCVVSLKERTQIERRAERAIRHCWNRTILDAIDRPIGDRRSSLTARAPFALPSARTGLTHGATATRATHELPTISRNSWNPRSIATRKVARAVIFDDVQTRVSFMRVISAADMGCEAVVAIATGARNADPIRAARSLRRVPTRLPERTFVANKLRLVAHALLTPSLHNRQPARRHLDASL